MDASPLILLGKVGELSWVHRLGEVVIPQAVANEILQGSADDPARCWLNEPAGLSLVHETPPAGADLLAWDLGAGESAVLSWARCYAGYETVLDDAAARRCAAVFGVRVRGTLSLASAREEARFRGTLPPSI